MVKEQTIEILTTVKKVRHKNFSGIEPNLVIKSVNDRPYATEVKYLPDGKYAIVKLTFEKKRARLKRIV